MREGTVGQGLFVDARRQGHHEVETGRDAFHLQPWQVRPQRRDQRIPAPAVDGSHLPQMTIEAATFDEVGEGQLVESRRSVVGMQFGERHPIDQRVWKQQPANPEGWGQRLARGPEVRDTPIRHTLQGAYGLAIESVLGIVVVLDDDSAMTGRPLEQRRPALGREDDPGRELVGGRHQHGADVQAVQPLDAQPATVHGNRLDAQAHGLNVCALAAVSGILDGHATHAARPQRLADEAETLCVPRTQDDAVLVCDRAARPIQVDGQRGARADRTERIRIPEGVVGAGNSTIHAVANQTAYFLPGDATAVHVFPSGDPEASRYFLTGVEVEAVRNAAAIAVLGDSITDGVGSTVDGDARWPDALAARLQAERPTASIAVVNAGIAGNRILNDARPPFIGPSSLSRFDRDVLDTPGLRWIILLQGSNDISGADMLTTPEDRVSARQIIDGMQALIARAHARGVRILGGTLLPREGVQKPFVSTDAGREKRRALNTWIRTAGAFDGVIDFERVMGDPARPDRLNPAFDSGDHPAPERRRLRRDGRGRRPASVQVTDPGLGVRRRPGRATAATGNPRIPAAAKKARTAWPMDAKRVAGLMEAGGESQSGRATATDRRRRAAGDRAGSSEHYGCLWFRPFCGVDS